MKPKPKLLFLAGYFPPAYKSSGSVRGWNIAKYLSRLGWDVTVVTPHPAIWQPKNIQNVEAIETELKKAGIKRILTGYRWPFLAGNRVRYRDDLIGRWLAHILGGITQRLGIDSWIGWMVDAKNRCSSLEQGDVNLILASGTPFISFKLANILARKLKCPYVLDYRDLWTSNPHLKEPPKKIRREEKKLLVESAAITVVSPSIAHVLAEAYPIGNKLTVVTNGYDSEKMALIQPCSFNRFAMVYTGVVLPPERDIAPFMAVLQKLKLRCSQDLPDWEFHYYGSTEKIVQDRAACYGVMDKVIIHGHVPYETVLSATKGANLSLIITCVSQRPTIEEKGIVTGKIFESIGLEIPMLIITPPGSDVRPIVDTVGRGACFAGDETDAMVDYIISIMCSKIPPVNDPQRYSWERLAQSLDQILRKALDTSSSQAT